MILYCVSATIPDAYADWTKLCWVTKYTTTALWRLVAICDAWLTSEEEEVNSWFLTIILSTPARKPEGLESGTWLLFLYDNMSDFLTSCVNRDWQSSWFRCSSLKNYLRVESTPFSYCFLFSDPYPVSKNLGICQYRGLSDTHIVD